MLEKQRTENNAESFCFLGKCNGPGLPKGFVAASPAAGLVAGCVPGARSRPQSPFQAC